MTTVTATKILRLCETNTPAALGRLGQMAIETGMASLQTDGATIVRRMRQAAEQFLSDPKLSH